MKKKRSGRSWEVRFGEFYGFKREEAGLGGKGKSGGRAGGKKTKKVVIEKSSRNERGEVEIDF